MIILSTVVNLNWLDHPTAENTVISPNFLVWKFCGKAQFGHSFGRFVQNYAEIVPFQQQEIR